MKTRRFHTVAIFDKDGTRRGQTVLDSRVDRVDNQYVNTLPLAERYANEYLVHDGQYAIVMLGN